MLELFVQPRNQKLWLFTVQYRSGGTPKCIAKKKSFLVCALACCMFKKSGKLFSEMLPNAYDMLFYANKSLNILKSQDIDDDGSQSDDSQSHSVINMILKIINQIGSSYLYMVFFGIKFVIPIYLVGFIKASLFKLYDSILSVLLGTSF